MATRSLQELYMKDCAKILVIEDRDNHIRDAKRMFKEIVGRLPIRIEVVYATYLKSTMMLIDNVDAVMTDVFFPDVAGGEEMPNGQKVVEHCLNIGKPVLWVTSTYHHGNKTNPLNNWGRSRGLEMFDCPNAENGEDMHKPWKRAFYGLLAMVIGMEMGRFHFVDGVFKGPFARSPSMEIYNVDDVIENGEDEDLDEFPVTKHMKELGF